jgi:hypothetical protein
MTAALLMVAACGTVVIAAAIDLAALAAFVRRALRQRKRGIASLFIIQLHTLTMERPGPTERPGRVCSSPPARKETNKHASPFYATRSD